MKMKVTLRIGWLVAGALILGFFLIIGPLYPSLYAREVAARGGNCASPGLGDGCAWAIGVFAFVYLLEVSLLVMAILWILSIVQAVRLRQRIWLAAMATPMAIAALLFIGAQIVAARLATQSDFRQGPDLYLRLEALSLGSVLVAFLLNLAYSFWAPPPATRPCAATIPR